MGNEAEVLIEREEEVRTLGKKSSRVEATRIAESRTQGTFEKNADPLPSAGKERGDRTPGNEKPPTSGKKVKSLPRITDGPKGFPVTKPKREKRNPGASGRDRGKEGK